MVGADPENTLANRRRINDLSDATCVICLEGLQSNGASTIVCAPVGSPCPHSLHRACAMMYLAVVRHSGETQPRCPVCRQDWQQDGLLEIEVVSCTSRHFWLTDRPNQSLSSSIAGFPSVAAPPTLNSSSRRVDCAPAGSYNIASQESSSAFEAASQINSSSRNAGEKNFEGIPIRNGYVRRQKRNATPLLQRCPLTGTMVSIEDASRHVQMVLRDRKIASGSSAHTDLPSHMDNIRASLTSFASKRPDLCGTMEQEIYHSFTHRNISSCAPSTSSVARESRLPSKRLRLEDGMDAARKNIDRISLELVCAWNGNWLEIDAS